MKGTVRDSCIFITLSFVLEITLSVISFLVKNFIGRYRFLIFAKEIIHTSKFKLKMLNFFF